MIVCVRGATTVEADEKELIYEAVTEMMREIIDANHIRTEDIASIVFTATNDLKSAYPAVAVRNMGITEPALMCLQEMHVEVSLRKCLRVMVTAEGDYDRKSLRHAYLRGAVGLRPDLRK